MDVLAVVCYTVGTLCFLLSVFRNKIQALTLDLVALGLLLWTFPTLLDVMLDYLPR